jgi:hypothetical protein
MINGDSVMKSTNLPSADEEAVRRGAAVVAAVLRRTWERVGNEAVTYVQARNSHQLAAAYRKTR